MDNILLNNYNNDQALQAKYASFDDYKAFMNSPERMGDNSGLYSIRDQLNRDFLQGGLLRDAKESLGQTYDSVINDMGSMGQKVNNFVTEDIPSGLEKIQQFYSKLPTLTNLRMKTDKFDTLPQQDRDYITNIMEGANSDQGLAGFYKDPNSGLLKDMMNKNVRSLRGNYAKYIRDEYDRRFNEMNPGYVDYTTPLQLAKNSFIQKQFQKQEDLAAKEAAELAQKNQVRLGDYLVQDKSYKSDPGLSAIGRAKYTGPGMAFEARNTGTGKGPK